MRMKDFTIFCRKNGCIIFVFLLLSCAIQQILSLTVSDTLPIPYASQNDTLQTGCTHSTANKGFSVISSGGTSFLFRFTLNPLSFSPDDNRYLEPDIDISKQCFVDPVNGTLYLSGSNGNIGKLTVAIITSFNITNGTTLEPLTSYSSVAQLPAGFIAATNPLTPGFVYASYVQNNSTYLVELNLQSTRASVINQGEIYSPVAKEIVYEFFTVTVSSKTDSNFVFSTKGHFNTPSPTPSSSPSPSTTPSPISSSSTPTQSTTVTITPSPSRSHSISPSISQSVSSALPSPSTTPQISAASSQIRSTILQNNDEQQSSKIDYLWDRYNYNLIGTEELAVLGSYGGAYPWGFHNFEFLPLNSSVIKVISCENHTSTAILYTFCNETNSFTTICDDYYVAVIGDGFVVGQTIFITTYHRSDDETLYITFTSYHVLPYVFITINNIIYQINIENGSLDKQLLIPSVNYFVWTEADPERQTLFAGATLNPLFSTIPNQIYAIAITIDT